jgi:rare lipoprotein A
MGGAFVTCPLLGVEFCTDTARTLARPGCFRRWSKSATTEAMRRSLRLVAAMLWLLELAACADEPPPKSPTVMMPARRAEVSRLALRSAEPRRPGSVQVEENPANSPQVAASAHVVTEPQLVERFAKARPLSVQRGSASYYSDKFAGRSTASGAPYEPRGFTAAHRSLPFGTVVRVTRLDGGQVVYVRVTDRGPYARGRILDLSRAAAEQLGMMRAGVVKIKAEVVEYGPRKKRRRRR